MTAILHAGRAFGATLWQCRPGRNRSDFEAWQRRKLAAWLRDDLRRVDGYRDFPKDVRLDQIPVMDKAATLARFEAFNRAGITASMARAAWETTGRIGDINIGASTGTSGNRGFYAVTKAEQGRWLGTILAKTVPRFLVQKERVAVILPQNSALYDTAARSRVLRVQFFDLRVGIEGWGKTLQHFDPTTIVAPPRILRALAQGGLGLKPRRIYAGGETLDPVDSAAIEAGFGARVGQIYMATEGLLAVTCRAGRIHLAEDANYFEFEPAGEGLVSPLLTSFQRRFQIMARYRMNDLLRLSDRPCSCGSPLRVVDEIVGRMDDCFSFGKGAQTVLVTPDVLRNALIDAIPDARDFRIIRMKTGAVHLRLLPETRAEDVARGMAALRSVFQARGICAELNFEADPLVYCAGRKLRRVENRYTGVAQ